MYVFKFMTQFQLPNYVESKKKGGANFCTPPSLLISLFFLEKLLFLQLPFFLSLLPSFLSLSLSEKTNKQTRPAFKTRNREEKRKK